MASITPYKDGWRAQIKIGDVRDSQTFRTQREAKAWAAHRETEIRAQKGRDPGELHTVGEMFRKYVETVSDKKAGARSEALRLKAFEKDFPHLAEMKLSDFKTPQLVEWRDARLKKVKPGSVVRDINLIRNVFYTARDEWHWLTHNPFTGFKIPQEGAPRDRRIDPWGEVRPICRALGYVSRRAPETKSQEVALAFLVALRSAMRAGEILQLGKSNCDLQKRVAVVGHKMQHLTGKPRSIPFTRHTARLLTPLADRDRFFTIDAASLDALFRKTKTRLKITGLHFHDSRAEALTRLARRVDVLTLSKISGHTDLRMLSEVYYRESAEDIAARI
ncbi:TPA: tyrosine-type recombinase/integrase [Burkholderia multivorans]|nr:tyrosine-type recombinase/integrase [Burkholderia multivorans]HDR9840124.1 tyrosine-type recombinase/integrase [Burkholderia multivorans]HDR9846712.1 tyrosine-type recombinase/integrase [Burkholderia multivorans]HDR9853121.1 tyrosine-type recombinase/integrase [Burkholderia multivorans]